MKKHLLYLAIVLLSSSCLAQLINKPGNVTIINIYDAFGRADDELQQDFGFSSIIHYNGKTILFDAGTDTKIFEQNIRTLNVDLKKIDIAILSHGHYDHMGGFDHLISINPDVKIYLPNDFFSLGAPVRFPFKDADPLAAKTLGKDEQYFRGQAVVDGMKTTPTGRFWKGNVQYVTESIEVLPGLTIIATTSDLMGTFIKYPPFEKNPQFIEMPELSASFATKKGQILIAGCSHSTIESIIKRTMELIPTKIFLVAGGFHLIPYERGYIEGLAKRVREVYDIESVAPAHCTGHLGFSVFKQEFGKEYRFFGLGERLDLAF
jgi:7,8-dihydropterin-6-yl-methyl-4-(beta-D-ribofuranosyl)aminobenzene 5'-phosphate synthase